MLTKNFLVVLMVQLLMENIEEASKNEFQIFAFETSTDEKEVCCHSLNKRQSLRFSRRICRFFKNVARIEPWFVWFSIKNPYFSSVTVRLFTILLVNVPISSFLENTKVLKALWKLHWWNEKRNLREQSQFNKIKNFKYCTLGKSNTRESFW
jgi:hypothetical protein